MAGAPQGRRPPTAETWPNITEQKKALPGADDAAKEDNKIAALTLEGGRLTFLNFAVSPACSPWTTSTEHGA